MHSGQKVLFPKPKCSVKNGENEYLANLLRRFLTICLRVSKKVLSLHCHFIRVRIKSQIIFTEKGFGSKNIRFVTTTDVRRVELNEFVSFLCQKL